MIEGVLVLLVFVAILVGVFDMGQALFLHQTLVERARNACRYGVVNYGDTSAIRNMVLYNTPTAPDGDTPGIFGLTTAMVNVARSGLNTNNERIEVTISGYPFRFVSPWIAGIYNGRPIVVSLPVELP